MPSPKHPCAHSGCTNLVSRKEYKHCRQHVQPKTPEHLAKIKAAIQGKTKSAEHRAKLSTARRGPGLIDRLCERCGAPFRVAKPCRKQRFCSRSCGYTNRQGQSAKSWRHDMPLINCEICGKEIRAEAISVKRRTCSKSCKAILGRREQKNKHTKIERLMAEALRNAGVKFRSQHVIPKVCIPDFYIPALHAAVFCDGDYWHRLPQHVAKDAKDNAELARRGYRVFRFWEKQILTDLPSCIALLQQALPSRILDTLL